MTPPRFLADENFRGDIVAAVRRADPSIEFETVQELDLRGEPDEALLWYAAAESLVVVSHDVNTMIAAANARLAAGLELAGLVLVGQWSDARAVTHDLVLIANVSDADEWIGRIDFVPWPQP